MISFIDYFYSTLYFVSYDDGYHYDIDVHRFEAAPFIV